MALLMGRYSHSTGVIDHTDRLAWNARTVAHHFADAGYHTGLTGKMHFNDAQTHGFQFMMGFNHWFQYLGPIYTHGDIEELYDMQADRLETRNLLVKSLGSVTRPHREMKDRLLAWYDPARNPYRPKA